MQLHLIVIVVAVCAIPRRYAFSFSALYELGPFGPSRSLGTVFTTQMTSLTRSVPTVFLGNLLPSDLLLELDFLPCFVRFAEVQPVGFPYFESRFL